jgi:hypothetical protein
MLSATSARLMRLQLIRQAQQCSSLNVAPLASTSKLPASSSRSIVSRALVPLSPGPSMYRGSRKGVVSSLIEQRRPYQSMTGEKKGETDAKILAEKVSASNTMAAAAAPPAAELEKRAATRDPDDDPLKLNTAGEVSLQEQRAKDWSIIRKLLAHIWPKDDKGIKVRVVLAVALLIGGKVRLNLLR